MRRYGIALMAGLLIVVCLHLIAGCALFNPGGQVATALDQSKIYEWRADGSIWIEARGPQTEGFKLWEGSCPQGENGEPNFKSPDCVTTHFLHVTPSAKDAAGSMNFVLQQTTEQMRAANEMLLGIARLGLSQIAAPARTEGDLP